MFRFPRCWNVPTRHCESSTACEFKGVDCVFNLEYERRNGRGLLHCADSVELIPGGAPKGERCPRPTSFLCELQLSIGSTASGENGEECGVTLMRRLSRV